MPGVHAVAVGLSSASDAAANRSAAVRAVHAAADDGAGLVVLPEYASRFDPRGVGPASAEPLDGPFVTALVEVAAARSLVVVAGTVVPGESGGAGRAANVVVVVGPHGVQGAYRKVHLYDAFGQRESDRFDGGDPAAAPLVVEVGGLGVGVMTCYDLRFPESARRLVDAGAEVLVVPAAWAAGALKADHWRTLLRARAIENTSYVVGASMRGPGVTGDPIVIDPVGRVLDEATAAGAVTAQARLDRAVLDEVRAANPSLVNRRYGVVPLP